MLTADPPAALSRTAAIVGVGHTDYAEDYRPTAPGHGETRTATDFAAIAFERAVADAGLRPADVDGLSVHLMYSTLADDEVSTALGTAPRHLTGGRGIMAGAVPAAVAALAEGRCDTLALVYAATPRAIGRQYGGHTYSDPAIRDRVPASYYAYHPWGWSSQAAHWAMASRYYQHEFGIDERRLAAVSLAVRANAVANPAAIMRQPLTVEDYLESRFIVRPMRVLDLCLVNNGAVCLVLRRADDAAGGAHRPVLVAGWSDVGLDGPKLDRFVRDRLHTLTADATAAALAMAGLALEDVDHFQGYDSSSFHLLTQVEGCGFAPPGRGLELFEDGRAAVDGSLPINTSGGMLSEAYMHGWNHVVEAVRQLRHEAGDRQVPAVERSLFSLATTDSVHPLLLERAA